MTNNLLSEHELKELRKNPALRRRIARESHYWFFCLYLGEYIQYPFAPIHKSMFRITENTLSQLDVIVAFRSSSKSTLFSLSYVIWSIVGNQEKKFVLIVSQTQSQARQMMANIRMELEKNDLLKSDIGPFQESSDEWGSSSIVLADFNARITIASTEQSIRGLKHGRHRPDLIICDDIEDLNSVKTRDGRDKAYSWFTSELLPVGDLKTKIVVVGNLLHEDSLLMRLKSDFEAHKLDGRFHQFPLISDDGEIAWQAKFPTMFEVENLKRRIGSESAWSREYLLKIISDEGRIIHPQWIQYYSELPKGQPRAIVVGVDLAISEKTTADFTAVVTGYVYGFGSTLKIFILPNILNKRLTFPKTIDYLVDLYRSFPYVATLCIENVGYQESVVQQLAVLGVRAVGKSPKGQDKRSRLSFTTQYVMTGKILFPDEGAGRLVDQLVNFGVEKNDDMADAFSILINDIIETDRPDPGPTREPSIALPNYVELIPGEKTDLSKPLFSRDEVY